MQAEGSMVEELSFERALAELEKVVERLQQPDVPLEEAIALYRRGTKLAEQSEELLSRAELQVQELTQAVRERFVEYAAEEDDTQGD
jgi:exodeoxyribonuclease VII small subunit